MRTEDDATKYVRWRADAYKTLMSHIQVNQLSTREPKGIISCFEFKDNSFNLVLLYDTLHAD